MNHYYSFYDYMGDVGKVVSQITNTNKKYDMIVGIKRGGLIFGTHLSHILGVPLEVLQWSSKGVRESSNPHLLTSRNKNVLLVDDILDAGDTLRGVLETYWPMDTACLIFNKSNPWKIEPTYTSWVIDRETFPNYIDFWWEKL